MMFTCKFTAMFSNAYTFLSGLFTIKTNNFRVCKQKISLMEKDLVRKGNEGYCYVVQQKNSVSCWDTINISHIYKSCGKSRKITVPLSFGTNKEAEQEINRIEKKLPSIVEKIFCGNELDRIIREVRNI